MARLRNITLKQLTLISIISLLIPSIQVSSKISLVRLSAPRELNEDDVGGFKISERFREAFDEEALSREEDNLKEAELADHRDHSVRHHFERGCPHGYFTCANGECLSPKWRCDGHYDCDDFSDEINCTQPEPATSGQAGHPLEETSHLMLEAEHRLGMASSAHDDSLLSQPSISPASSLSSSLVSSSPPLPSQQSSAKASQRVSSTASPGSGQRQMGGQAVQTGSQEAVHEEAPHEQPNPTQGGDLTFTSPDEPLMLFSTGSAIRGIWLRSRIYFDVVSYGRTPKSEPPPSITQALSIFFGGFMSSPPATVGDSSNSKDSQPNIKSRSTIVGIDLDPNNKEIFWVELGKDTGVFSTIIDDEQFEPRHRRNFGSPEAFVDSGLLSPEDLAFDALGKNLYITDAGLPAVVVCSQRHNLCKKLIVDGLHKPRAILIEPSTGWLIFSDWGDRPGIYLATMDGRRRETLIDSDIIWPNGLALDSPTNQLFWADARLSKIERVDLATRRRKLIIRESTSNPFSLAVFEKYLFWSDWYGNDIRTCEKQSGNNSHSMMRAQSIYGIHVYHPSLEVEPPTNPCWSKRCSHLCLLSATPDSFSERKFGSITASCTCPESMALSIGDRSTCYDVQLSFLFVNVKNYVARVHPDRIGLNAVETIVYSSEHAIHDIASDWFHYRLFFYDASSQHVHLVHLGHGEKAKVEQFVDTNHSSVRGMLYDSPSDNLYWLDSDSGTIQSCHVSTKFQYALRYKLEMPVSMALDSRNRLFYIAQIGRSPRIFRTDIQADPSSDLEVVAQDIGLPISIHLDERLQRLYWADAKYESIESIELNPKSSSSAVKSHQRIAHRRRLGSILAFAVFHDHFLWAIKNGDYLYKAKMEPDVESALRKEETRLLTLKLPQSASPRALVTDNKRILAVEPQSNMLSGLCAKKLCPYGCYVDSTLQATCVGPSDISIKINKSPSGGAASSGLPAPQASQPSSSPTGSEPAISAPRRSVWPVFVVGLTLVAVTLAIGFIYAYRRRLPHNLSQLHVSFASAPDKEGSMLLLD